MSYFHLIISINSCLDTEILRYPEASYTCVIRILFFVSQCAGIPLHLAVFTFWYFQLPLTNYSFLALTIPTKAHWVILIHSRVSFSNAPSIKVWRKIINDHHWPVLCICVTHVVYVVLGFSSPLMMIKRKKNKPKIYWLESQRYISIGRKTGTIEIARG